MLPISDFSAFTAPVCVCVGVFVYVYVCVHAHCDKVKLETVVCMYVHQMSFLSGVNFYRSTSVIFGQSFSPRQHCITISIVGKVGSIGYIVMSVSFLNIEIN